MAFEVNSVSVAFDPDHHLSCEAGTDKQPSESARGSRRLGLVDRIDINRGKELQLAVAEGDVPNGEPILPERHLGLPELLHIVNIAQLQIDFESNEVHLRCLHNDARPPIDRNEWQD